MGGDIHSLDKSGSNEYPVRVAAAGKSRIKRDLAPAGAEIDGPSAFMEKDLML